MPSQHTHENSVIQPLIPILIRHYPVDTILQMLTVIFPCAENTTLLSQLTFVEVLYTPACILEYETFFVKTGTDFMKQIK